MPSRSRTPDRARTSRCRRRSAAPAPLRGSRSRRDSTAADPRRYAARTRSPPRGAVPGTKNPRPCPGGAVQTWPSPPERLRDPRGRRAAVRGRRPARSRYRTPGCSRGSHEHRHRHHQPRLVGERHVRFPDPQSAAHALAARREDHLGLAPRVLHHAHVADPHAVRKAGPHGLDDGLLGGESHGEKALAALRARELRVLLGHEQMLDEARAEALERVRDAPALQHIDTDAEDHARAAAISAFISRTAALRPTNRACAIRAWPMLSSTISRSAATGRTLW